MADFLEKVVRNENLELSRRAIEMIARNSVGGMRDALTAIDQILSFSGTGASDQKVAQILGILDSESRFAFTEALLRKNEGEAMRYFQQLQEHGHDAHDILADLLQTIKTTALVRSLGTSPALFQDISGDDLEIFASLSEAVSVDELQQIFNVLLELEEQMKHSAHTKICFEMAILQIASIQPLVGLPEIIKWIKNLRNGGPPAETNSENATSVKAIPEESTNPPTDNSSEKHHNILSVDSRVKKQPADASVIKNILQSETKETHKRADNQDNAVNRKTAQQPLCFTTLDASTLTDPDAPYFMKFKKARRASIFGNKSSLKTLTSGLNFFVFERTLVAMLLAVFCSAFFLLKVT